MKERTKNSQARKTQENFTKKKHFLTNKNSCFQKQMPQRNGGRRTNVRVNRPVALIAPRRPLEKFLVNARIDSGTGSLEIFNTDGFTFPGTLGGLRWTMTYLSTTGGIVQWVLVKVRDGLGPSTLAALAADSTSTLYTPEVDVMAAGLIPTYTAAAAVNPTIEGSTKTMRKMNKGDQIYLVVNHGAAVGNLNAVIQAFYKS